MRVLRDAGKGPLFDKAGVPDPDQPVTTLELFFDLVFVFTITQVTSLVRDSHGITGYLQAGAILTVTWWIYDGYAWLSNNIGPTTLSTRLPMVAGMAGLLVMAIATPAAFGDQAWAFAIAYLVVVLVHGLQFFRSALGGSAVAIRGILPINLGAAGLVLLAAVVGHHWAWLCWLGAVVVLALAVVLRRESGFTIRIDHFAERHQLIIIIALGETVVATGAGAQDRLQHPLVVVAVLTSVALLAALWWLYFGGDDERALEALADVPADRLASMALRSYSLVHLVHVGGLVLVAAGLHEVVAEPGHRLSLRLTFTMAAGIATFLTAELLFLASLHLPGRWPLAAGIVAALAVAPLGLASGLAEMAALAVVTTATVVGSARLRRVHPRTSTGS